MNVTELIHCPKLLITGASSGSAMSLVKVILLQDHNLVLIVRRRKKLTEIADELSRKFTSTVRNIVKDLSITASPEEIF